MFSDPGFLASLESDDVGFRLSQEWKQLILEPNAAMIRHACFGFALRLEQAGRFAPAIKIYQWLDDAGASQDDSHSAIHEPARRRLRALSGEGPATDRIESLLAGFTRESLDPALLLGMVGAGWIGRMGYAGLLGSLTQKTAGIWTRGLGATALAGVGSLLAEAPAFTLLVKGARQVFGHSPSWNPAGLQQEILAGAIFLGAMRIANFGGSRIVRHLGSAPHRITAASAKLFPQATLLAGTVVALQAQQWAKLKPASSAEGLVFDSLVCWLHFTVATRLLHGVTEPWYRLAVRELESRSQGQSSSSFPMNFIAAAPVFSPSGANTRVPNPRRLLEIHEARDLIFLAKPKRGGGSGGSQRRTARRDIGAALAKIETLSAESPARLRREAAARLRKIIPDLLKGDEEGMKRTLGILETLANYPDKPLRVKLIRILEALADTLRTDREFLKKAFAILHTLSQDPNPEIRSLIPIAVEAWIPSLKGDREGLRQAVQLLRQQSEDWDSSVRVEVAPTLMKLIPALLGHPESLKLALQTMNLLAMDVSPWVVGKVAEIEAKPFTKLTPLLNVPIEAERPRVKKFLMDLLTGPYLESNEQGLGDIVSALKVFSQDSNAGVRIHAATQLGNLAPRLVRNGEVLTEALGIIEHLRQESDPRVKALAEISLGKIFPSKMFH